MPFRQYNRIGFLFGRRNEIALWLKVLFSSLTAACLGILAYVNWWAAYTPGPASVARRSHFWLVGDIYASLALTVVGLFAVSCCRRLKTLDYMWIPTVAFVFIFFLQACSKRQS